MQASDIHVEPREGSLARALSSRRHAAYDRDPAALRARAVTSRIKIMAQLNIAERRLPQDGRIKTTVHGPRNRLCAFQPCRRCVAKASCCASSTDPACSSTSKLWGFAGPAHEAFAKLLDQPNGIILVTGPTGSGKTTTLYTALNALNTAGAQDLYRRGPDRVPARGRQSDPGAAQDRPQLRVRSALHPASGSRYHHGGRDPRPGDGTNVDPGLAHGTSGAFNRATPTAPPPL